MHAYGTNSKERTAVIVKLFPAAVVGAVVGLSLLEELGRVVGFAPPLWLQALVGGPSATGALLAVYRWIDQSGWRIGWIRRLLGIHLPDLNGRWRLSGRTSFVDPLIKASSSRAAAKGLFAAWLGKRQRDQQRDAVMLSWTAEVTIGQTWSELSVLLETGFSSSVSRSGSILINQDGGYSSLTYEYLNTPKPGARQTMQIHRGLARLILQEKDGKATLEGEYYSHPRDRGNFGLMRLERARNKSR